ncbi:MAG: hypothetical protein H0V95_11780 [Actinobacteria bacterium]|nr:hypothetical protein [Actinomycetota bacterium]
MLVLRLANAGVGNRPVGLPELRPGYVGDIRPELLSRVKIEALMEVDTNAEPRLVDIEEAAKPSAEEAHHRRVRVREYDGMARL